MRSERSAKNDATEECAQILILGTEKDVGSEHAQVSDHRESREGVAAAAYHLMISDSGQASRDEDGSTNTHFQKASTSKPPSNASVRQRESLSAAAVAGRTQQVINEEVLTASNTSSIGRESPIGIDDNDDVSEETQFRS